MIEEPAPTSEPSPTTTPWTIRPSTIEVPSVPALKLQNPSCITVVPAGEVGAEPDPVGVGDAHAVRHHVVGHPGELVDAEDLHRAGLAQRAAGCASKPSTSQGP